MMSLSLILMPVVAAVGVVTRSSRLRALHVLVLASLLASVLALLIAIAPAGGRLFAGYVRIDATSQLFLALVNPIFLGISIYVWNRAAGSPELLDGIDRFVALSLVFLAAVNAVLISNHFVVQCLALECTSLAAAPLISKTVRSTSHRASWHYLLFSMVGLALVSLGLPCLSRGAEACGHVPAYFIDQLSLSAAAPATAWHQLGLGLILLGLGTKLGLAPMYSWLPEAYDEAPPAVTAMLAAVQFNCALVMLLRVVQVYRPGNPVLVNGGLVAMGIVSMVVSTVSIIATRNLKRLLAYASINHAGVIAIGLGIGKWACYGLLLYALSNAYIKAVLFLTAGRIKAHYGTKDTRRIRGLVKDLPYSGVFLMIGTFALLGFPPFGSFIGELLILSALVHTGRMLVFGLFCVLITMTFVATGRTIFPMIWGESTETRDWPPEKTGLIATKIGILVALIVLGVYIPPVANELIHQVAASLEIP